MNKIGIFFGTDTGTTRLIAKKMWKRLGDALCDKPLNVNRITVADMLQYDSLILGTPSYGEGRLPGIDTGVKAGSWAEFLPQVAQTDLHGKRIALYGLGNQDKYPERFANSLFTLCEQLQAAGAEIVGGWPTTGYEFEHSDAVVDGRFVGLVLDQNNQAMMTDERIDQWLEVVQPLLFPDAAAPVSAAG